MIDGRGFIDIPLLPFHRGGGGGGGGASLGCRLGVKGEGGVGGVQLHVG